MKRLVYFGTGLKQSKLEISLGDPYASVSSGALPQQRL